MALGITVDFSARLGNLAGQLDRMSSDLGRFQTRAETMSSRVNKAFGALGVGLSIAGFVSFVKGGIDALDTLNDLHLKTGIAVEQLAGFQLAAKQSGTELESFASAANKLSVNIGKSGDEFAKLGITAKDPAEAFIQLADVFVSIQDPQQRAAVSAKALGKSWQEMAPLLSLGGAGLRKAVEEGSRLAGVTQEMADAADAFNDTFAKFGPRLLNLSVQIAGPVASAFNNLYESISNATQAGVSFNNVMSGIGNAFSHTQSFSGVAGELDKINKLVATQERKVNAIKNNGGIGSLIDDFAGTDINLEKNKLEALYNTQEKLANQLKATMKPEPVAKPAGPTQTAIKDYLGTGDTGKASPAAKAHHETKTAVDQLQKSYEAMLESLTREIALRDKNGEAAKLEYELINGNLKGLPKLQQDVLLNLAKEKDALELQDKKWAALVEDANNYYDIKKSTDDLIKSGGVQTGFNDQLARIQDSGIDPKSMQVEFTKLGKAYNDEFISPAVVATDALSQYSIQAARNMQTAFADFLFDPFKNGLDGMLKGFLDIIKRMVAEQASAQIFNSKDQGGLGLADLFKKGAGALFSAVAGGSSMGATDAAFLASANGNIFANGNVIPFARGGIFNQPTRFPMSGGKTGLLGEAGPEAVMPLIRGANGKLGIMANGGAGGGTINTYNVAITVPNNGSDTPDVTGQKIGEAFIRAISREEIKSASRPGNQLNPTTKFA
jgi:hypothetical protein